MAFGKTFFSVALALAAAVSISGCSISASSDGGGGAPPAPPADQPVTPLTIQQQAIFSNAADLVSEAAHWDHNFASAPSGKAQLQTQVSAGCKPVEINEKPADKPEVKGFKFELGPTCPISYNYRVEKMVTSDANTSSYTQKIDASLGYSAMSPGAQVALDVQSYTLKRGESMSASPQGISQKGAGSGQIVSKTYGTIDIKYASEQVVNQTTQTGSSIFRFGMAKSGMTVELKMTSSVVVTDGVGAMVYKYFLNNSEIDEKTFAGFATRFGFNLLEN